MPSLANTQHPAATAESKPRGEHEYEAAATGDGGKEDPSPPDEDPCWEDLMRHEPAKSEVPRFLAARGRRGDANDRFATGLDVLHESVTGDMEGLVGTVTALLNARASRLYELEEGLKHDYDRNERQRASMNKKLEESARIAQGLFANLLMRVARPEDAGTAAAATALGAAGGGGGAEGGGDLGADNDGRDEGGGEGDPDWDAIMKHEPAKTEVPVFLAARGRREASCARFAAAIEEFKADVDGYAQELTQTVAGTPIAVRSLCNAPHIR